MRVALLHQCHHVHIPVRLLPDRLSDGCLRTLQLRLRIRQVYRKRQGRHGRRCHIMQNHHLRGGGLQRRSAPHCAVRHAAAAMPARARVDLPVSWPLSLPHLPVSLPVSLLRPAAASLVPFVPGFPLQPGGSGAAAAANRCACMCMPGAALGMVPQCMCAVLGAGLRQGCFTDEKVSLCGAGAAKPSWQGTHTSAHVVPRWFAD
mmetsp:Transcript_22945/g.57510  ORF Transcript_22945/g.57510 Transcript_22945/m.57510 type:complete len:204 (+) Transcript_22945:277-888(+)